MSRQKYKGQPCYYCGIPASSKEHAPPQLMFKGFSCDSITVPACDKHNSAKSHLDQAVICVFLIPLHNGLKTYPLENDVKKAIAEAESSFDYAKRMAFSRSVLSNPPLATSGEKLLEVAYLTDPILPWIQQLTAALTYSALRGIDTTIDWGKVLSQ